MPFPAAETISNEEFEKVLSKLKFLLANLPAQLPAVNGAKSRYSTFLNFNLDPDILEKTGDEVATLGEQLKYVFG